MEIKDWPTDSDGNPMVLIKARVQEHIQTAKFCHLEIEYDIQGFSDSFCESGDVEEALANAYDIADRVLDEKRTPILEDINRGLK